MYEGRPRTLSLIQNRLAIWQDGSNVPNNRIEVLSLRKRQSNLIVLTDIEIIVYARNLRTRFSIEFYLSRCKFAETSGTGILLLHQIGFRSC